MRQVEHCSQVGVLTGTITVIYSPSDKASSLAGVPHRRTVSGDVESIYAIDCGRCFCENPSKQDWCHHGNSDGMLPEDPGDKLSVENGHGVNAYELATIEQGSAHFPN
jgi:hypothetical protein